MTHIENIPHILQHGITHRTSPNCNPEFVPIGDSSLIGARDDLTLNNGRKLGEYIPFYFGTRMPMLYVIQSGHHGVAPVPAEKIVYCVSSVHKIIEQELDFIFADGHARSQLSGQYTALDVEEIDEILDYKAIKDKYWIDPSDLDKKRRKEAEFLVLGDIPPSAISGYCVYNLVAQERMKNLGIDESKVIMRPNFYFENKKIK